MGVPTKPGLAHHLMQQAAVLMPLLSFRVGIGSEMVGVRSGRDFVYGGAHIYGFLMTI